MLVLLNGSMWFATDLLRLLLPNFMLEIVRISSGKVQWKTPVLYCEGQRVVVLDDVLDSGITLTNVAAELKRFGGGGVVTAAAVGSEYCAKRLTLGSQY